MAADLSGRKQRGRPWPKGASGNPRGRPKGSGLTGELRKAIAERADEILTAMIAKAIEGDVQAGRVLLDRLLPALKPEAALVDLPGMATAESLADRAAAVLQAAAEGRLPPDAATGLVTAIAALARLRETDELEARIRALEQRNGI